MPTIRPRPSVRIAAGAMAAKTACRAGLMLRIHLHALRHAPCAYLVAAWWHLLGKRVRARARFAPLLAGSSLAYRLWLHSEAAGTEDSEGGPPIVALVDIGAGQEALDQTLRSLEGITVLVLGTPDTPDLAAAARCIRWSENPWLLPVAAGDVLAPGAIAAYRRAVGETRGRVIYADDDLLSAKGQRHSPHFKPIWNSELYCHFDYLTGACIVRSNAAKLAAASGDDWAAMLVAFAVEECGEIGEAQAPQRLPQILHHRRSRLPPRVPFRLAPKPATIKALPPVSVIVPTRNRLDLLRTCMDGLARTHYPDMEVIVVDNGSDDPATLAFLDALHPSRYRVLRAPGPFNFSALNNRAAREATGELLCLLNNDIEVLSPDWLEIMAVQALRPEVGAVGARLLYPDGRIQHAGVVLGVGGGAAHGHRLLHPEEEGYFSRHALPQFVSAVTAACLVVRRNRFEAVGGLDEANFAVAFNDVDLCMRLNARRWQSLYEPRATLVHHESVSRGFDRDPVGAARLAGELAALQRLWGTKKIIDPYHHPELNPFSERFVVRL